MKGKKMAAKRHKIRSVSFCSRVKAFFSYSLGEFSTAELCFANRAAQGEVVVYDSEEINVGLSLTPVFVDRCLGQQFNEAEQDLLAQWGFKKEVPRGLVDSVSSKILSLHKGQYAAYGQGHSTPEWDCLVLNLDVTDGVTFTFREPHPTEKNCKMIFLIHCSPTSQD
jgi:hypothetical protein